jgi:hypothetical protein
MTVSRDPIRELDIWLARAAVVAIIALQFLFVNDVTIVPRWVMPVLEVLLLIPLLVATAWSISRTRRASTEAHWLHIAGLRRDIRRIFLALTALVSIANLTALFGLVRAMITGHAGNGQSLFLDSLNVWTTNVIIFALWYWNVDRGGPTRRASTQAGKADFLFTQQTVPQLEASGRFVPGFIDYLFLAFTNATAFSPADTYPLTARAKILMMIESAISLVTIAVVASRAVGILS